MVRFAGYPVRGEALPVHGLAFMADGAVLAAGKFVRDRSDAALDNLVTQFARLVRTISMGLRQDAHHLALAVAGSARVTVFNRVGRRRRWYR